MTNAYLFVTLIVFAMTTHRAYIAARNPDTDIINESAALLFYATLCGWAVWLLWERMA